ncbi:MAG: hypothetical protein EOL87_15925 [Spartobacteria bacterium]|nr:hypothetical protein [Spartobacteria bacterium]
MKKTVLNGIGDIYLRKVYQQQVRTLHQSRPVQDKLFKTFQRQLAGTALANEIHLQNYTSYKEFLAGFPPQPYAFYEPFVQRVLNGEPRVMYNDPVEYYFITSGTSGYNRKIIPCNSLLRSVITRYQQKVLSAAIIECRGLKLTSDRFAYGSKTQHDYISGIPRDYISGILPSLIPKPLRTYVVPSLDALAETSREAKIDRIIQESRHRDIRLISGLPVYMLQILKDMVEKLAITNLKEIWPNLEMCVYSGTPLYQYKKSLNQVAGVELNYLGGYVTTESPVGMEMPGLTKQRGYMVFAPDLILYSFQELNGKEKVALAIDELRVGGEYLVNFGTPNGMTHYAVHDYIKVHEVHPYVQFELQGRCGSAMNIAAEKVSELDIAKAVQLLQERIPVKIEHHFVHPSENNAQPAYKWLFATDTRIPDETLAEHIDQSLMTISSDYREARIDALVLAPPMVQCIPEAEIRQLYAQRQGKGQFKMKTAFTSEQAFRSFYETHLSGNHL